MPAGSLVVVGAGIRAPAQVTLEAAARIAYADCVFVLLADPVSEYWIRSINGAVESLVSLYAVGKPRRQTYGEMVARIVDRVRAGARVCAASYGHPGVFAYPLHQAVREVRALGHHAEMLAGVSAEDCLFADLGVDPGTHGAHSFEATDFLLYRRHLDTSSSLVLWQIGVIGEASVKTGREIWNPDGLEILRDKLLESYPPAHIVTVYEAAQYAAARPVIDRCALGDLLDAPVSALSTLFVPPLTQAPLDTRIAERLGYGLAPAGGGSR